MGLQLLSAADRFLIEDLKKMCEYLLSTKITLENAFEIYNASGSYNAPSLKHFAAGFILLKYDQIEFADVDHDILYDILNSL